MISAILSASSGLSAYSTKINSNANNIANAGTEGFKKSRVILSTAGLQRVKVQTERVDAPGLMIYEETSNGRELIEQSNVDLAEELPAMNLGSHFYKANLKTLQVADEMLGSLLKIKVREYSESLQRTLFAPGIGLPAIVLSQGNKQGVILIVKS